MNFIRSVAAFSWAYKKYPENLFGSTMVIKSVDFLTGLPPTKSGFGTTFTVGGGGTSIFASMGTGGGPPIFALICSADKGEVTGRSG